METINPIYNLGRVSVKDESTEKMSFYEIAEQQTNGSTMPAGQKTLRFRVDDLNSYLVPSRAYIQLTYQLLTAANGNLDNTYSATLKNGANGIFRRAILRLNNQAINNYSDYVYHKADLENVFKSKEWKRSMGSICGVRDTLSDNDRADSAEADYYDNNARGHSTEQLRRLNPRLNKAFRDGVSQHILSSHQVVNIPLHTLFPFLSAYDRVLRGVQMEVELELADDSIIIEQGVGTTDVKFAFVDRGAIMFMKKVIPSLAVRNELNNAITRGFSLKGFSFEDVEIYRQALANTAANTNDWRISTTVSRPTKVFIAFQDAECLTEREKSVSYFTGCGLEEIQLFVNGQPIPDLRYEVKLPDDYDGPGNNVSSVLVATGQYNALLGLTVERDRTRAYNNLLSLVGQDNSSVSSDLMNPAFSYRSWINKYLIYAFDVSNNLPQDTAFTGASEILVRFRLNGTYGHARNAIAWVYHEKLADINLTSTESSIVIS